MIDSKMLLHMISALDTLEKLVPGEEAGEYAVKKREWEALKKPAGPNTGPRRGGGPGWECES